jgi:ketosteroid isomerase-like protein
MQQNSNVDIVRSGYEAFGRGDLDALMTLFAEDISWVTPGPPELPTAGNRRGLQQVGEFFQTLDTHFEVQQFIPRDFIAEGNKVVVTGDEVARSRKTGRPINIAWCHVFDMRDGKVATFNEYFDTFAVVDAMREKAAAAGA